MAWNNKKDKKVEGKVTVEKLTKLGKE